MLCNVTLTVSIHLDVIVGNWDTQHFCMYGLFIHEAPGLGRLISVSQKHAPGESKKLNSLYIGPCDICKQINPVTYHLEWPPTLQNKPYNPCVFNKACFVRSPRWSKHSSQFSRTTQSCKCIRPQPCFVTYTYIFCDLTIGQ